MNMPRQLDQWLRSEETSQLLSVLLLLLTVVLLFTWTSNPSRSNDSWYSVTAVRLTGLGLFATWAAVVASSSRTAEALSAWLVTALAAAVTVPFELVAFAASYPAASLPGTMLFSFSFPLGLFGISWLLARLFGRARWLAVPAVIALAAALFMLDGLTGLQLLSPVTIITSESWALLLSWSLLALLTLIMLLFGGRSDD